MSNNPAQAFLSGIKNKITKEQLKEKAETYLMSSDDMFNTIHSKLYLIAGNIITNYSEADGIQSANYYDDVTQKPKTQLIDAAVEMALDHAGYCLALVPGGKNNRANMSSIRLTSADKKLVSDVVIDFSKVNGDIVRLASETKQGGEIRVWDGGRTLSTDMTGLLIVKGDVTVEADFTGLILASGKVTVNGNHEMKADSILVGNLLEYVKTDEELAKLFYALNGAVKYDSTKLEECIAYQNWERNAE